jgi:hypothetical protein
MIEDIRYLQYMDQDTDLKLLPPEAVLRKKNLRSNNHDGKRGVNIAIGGTALRATFPDYDIVGWCQDVERKAVICFLKQNISPFYKKIIRYYLETNDYDNILTNSAIYLGDFVDADVVGDMLYWSDGGEPKKINIKKAVNYGDTSVPERDRYVNVSSENLKHLVRAAKAYPVWPEMLVKYENELMTHRNYLRGALYQFRYQYVYDDDERSAWSPVSNVPFPNNEAAINAIYAQEENKDNRISITYYVGKENVKSINFAFRKGNFGHWKQFARRNVFDEDGKRLPSMPVNGTRVIKFYGNEITYGLDQQEVERLFHDVPLQTKHQRFINGSNLIYANYYSGYGNIDVGLDLDVEREKVDFTDEFILPISDWTPISSPAIGMIYFNPFVIDGQDDLWEFQSGDEVDIAIQYYDSGITETVTIVHTCADNDTFEVIWENVKSIFIDIVGEENVFIESGDAIDNKYAAIVGRKDSMKYITSILGWVKRGWITQHNCVKTIEGNKAFTFHLGNKLNISDLLAVSIEYYDTGEGANVTQTFTKNILTESVNVLVDSFVAWFEDNFVDADIETVGALVVIPDFGGGEDITEIVAKYVFSNEGITPISTWKNGSSVEVGIVYYDKVGRSGGVQGEETVYVPFYGTGEDYPTGGGVPFHYQNKIKTTIQGYPPEWAHSYQLVVSPKRKGFFQYLTDKLERDAEKGMVKIFLNDAILEGITFNSNVNYGYYDFQKGDRVRFLARFTGDGHTYVSDDYSTFKLVDLQIIEVGYKTGDNQYQEDDAEGNSQSFIFDEHGNKIKKRTAEYLLVKDFDFEALFLDRLGVLLEVYTPESIDDDNNVFYETGKRYSVSNPGSNQRQHSESTVILDKGDVYIRPRMRTVDKVFLCEDAHYSDIYESNVWDRGRPNIYIENAKGRWFDAQLKHSKKYLRDSINGLSDFDSESTVLDLKHGSINALTESGYILKVNQDRKNTSIYIGRTVFDQASGQQGYVGLSDKLIGTVMPSQMDYGTVFTKSVLSVNTHQYFFDVFKGSVVRDAYNGPFPISSYGFTSYFKKIASEMINEGIENCDVHFGWNGKHQELFVTTNVNGDVKTVVFSEADNKWSFESDSAEMYLWFGDTFLAWKDHKLWEHNTESDTIYDTPIDTEVDVVFNAVPIKNKIFNNVQVKGSGNWEADVEVIEEGNTTMESKLFTSDFKTKQQIKWANFRRNTKESANESLALVNGSRLRGRLLKLKLKGTGEIAWATVKSILSEKS